jgi:uncharacterized protein YndB with AHSA1/START domain
MLASIQNNENGYTVTFERHWNFPVQEVWAYFTENEKLKQWFKELSIQELRKGGTILFDMQDDTFEEMTILELKEQSVLEFTWDEDIVRLELYEEEHGCRLLLIEKINQLTPHTPKDLAGWHVCLDVVHTLLQGNPVPFRKEAWEKWYEEYKKILNL